MHSKPLDQSEAMRVIDERIQPAFERRRGARISGELLLSLQQLPLERLVVLAEQIEAIPPGSYWLQALVYLAEAVNGRQHHGTS